MICLVSFGLVFVGKEFVSECKNFLFHINTNKVPHTNIYDYGEGINLIIQMNYAKGDK